MAGIPFVSEKDSDNKGFLAGSIKKSYKKITKKIIDEVKKIKKVETEGSLWNTGILNKGEKGYLMPANFVSKKGYRGMNALLLRLGKGIFKNPYFLTKKQIEKLKGKLKKGTKPEEIFYYTMLFKYKDEKHEFKTYEFSKMINFLKNKKTSEAQKEMYLQKIPILKFYEVYNCEHVTGVDFKLDSLSAIDKIKLGFMDRTNEESNERQEIPEIIIKNFPKNSAKTKAGNDAGYVPKLDVVLMPHFKSFKTATDYYRVLFHEIVHSTGHSSRLKRKIENRFGTKEYAKEELIAELGAVFLSAQAGFLWKTTKSQANYLKDWLRVAEYAEKEEYFLLHCASEAQKAVDLLLQVTKKGEPKFYSDLRKKIKGGSLAGNSLRNKNLLFSKLKNRGFKKTEYYKIERDAGTFLGKIEKKQKESVVITVTGTQGSMKTRFAFQFMNALAQRYRVGHASIEEHPDSSLYFDKVEQYINKKALKNIEAPEVKSLKELESLIRRNDVVVIDSFAKMQEIDRAFEIDKDLRKKYNGKLFLVVFQQTADGKMRGGSKSQFDADIVLFSEKKEDYKDTYVFADKNRYQSKSLDDLKFNVFKGKLMN